MTAHPISAFMLPTGFLGSAVPVKNCAKGVLFTSGKTQPVPGGGWTPPEKSISEAVASRMIWWVVGIGAVAGIAYIASKGGVLSNPSLQGHWESETWERAYREALREGLKRSEAEEYAHEVLQAERDDRLNALGGALGHPNEYANPGRAQKSGFTRADADPEQLRLGIKHELEHTDSEKVAERIALDHLAETPDYYTKLDAMERGAFRGNPTRAESYRAATDAARRASSLIAAARRARGAERERLLDEAEVFVRQSVEHGRAAGDTWMSYESSSGREEIEKLRGVFRGNPDSGAPYTLEDVNTLTGTRTHRKATKYETLNGAMQRAQEKASQIRKFAEVNILDRHGNLIMTFVGEK